MESARNNSENGGFQLLNLVESAGNNSKIGEALIITMGASTGKSCRVPETIQKSKGDLGAALKMHCAVCVVHHSKKYKFSSVLTSLHIFRA